MSLNVSEKKATSEPAKRNEIMNRVITRIMSTEDAAGVIASNVYGK
jgi:hypothetical protein